MATINKNEILQRIIRGLRLDPALEKTPKEIAEKILPVFVINEVGDERVIADTTINSNDKSFVVPAGMKWKIKWVFVNYVSNATAGNRRLQVNVLDQTGGTVVFRSIMPLSQAASLTRDFLWMPRMGGSQITNVAGYGACPQTLYEGMELHVADGEDISSTDDFTLGLVYEEVSMTA